MITINLVPPEKKKQIVLLRRYIQVKDLIVFLMLIISIIAIVLLVSKLLLTDYFTEVVNQNSLLTRYVQVFDVEVKKFNGSLNTSKTIQNEFIHWSDFIIELSKSVPADISINSLSVNGDKLLIAGQAKTRDTLLRLKENLEKSELLAKVEVPLDNLLKKENISYSIKADILINNIGQK